MATDPRFIDGINTLFTKFTDADTTTSKTIFTAGADGSVVYNVNVASDDTAAINLKLNVTNGGVDYLLGNVNVPITAGFTGAIPAVALLTAGGATRLIPGTVVDNNGNACLYLKSGDTLEAACTATMTAGKTCHVAVFGADY
jgi:hypothetical protein